MNLEQDTYWQEDITLFEGLFSYFCKQNKPRPVPVRAKVHSSQERYCDVTYEIVPISTPKGTRTYFNIHPYVEEPNIFLTVGIPPKGYADTAAIGRVQGAKVEGFRPIQIGNVQAWYYPLDKTLVVWECYLFNQFTRSSSPNIPVMRDLWQSIEKQLHTIYATAERIVTPFADPLYTTEEYQAFLRSLGYEPVAQAAYGKLL